jgi:3-methylcrotonyl-CoA carboxylase alpha subunit
METISLKKILVANRGEIAMRIVKSIRSLGIPAVAVYAEDDKDSLHVSSADEAFSLGEGGIKDTYLNIHKIIEAALFSGCDAIHPGYGLLSENSLFAKACREHNLIFIGPSKEVLQLMADKTEARKMVAELGIPILSGYECSVSELLLTKDLCFPLIVKPSLGGGGKGMHIVHHSEELQKSVKTASREADNYFADSRVYFEQYIEFARHIEIQIAADHFGNVIHLFERECTIQRNFQKIIEEAPSPSLDDGLRNTLTSAAVKIAQAAKYANIGTVEFLLDEKNNWYFIEMNTRIQVEHPVTEAITGIDLVKLQLEIASDRPLPFSQDNIRMTGHAIELRVNAEDTLNHFRPSSGDITLFTYPVRTRFDTFINAPYVLTSHYDSLLGKLVVWAEDRIKAHDSAMRFLEDVHVHGIETNVPFLKEILKSNQFVENKLYTRYCNDLIPSFVSEFQTKKEHQPFYIPVIAFVFLNFGRKQSSASSAWQHVGYWRFVQEVRVRYNKEIFFVRFQEKSSQWIYRISDTEYIAQITYLEKIVVIKMNGFTHKVYYSFTRDGRTIIETGGFVHKLESPDLLGTAVIKRHHQDTSENLINNYIRAPLHGRVIKINVLENTKINRGDVLLVIESMKTENNITAPRNGFIKTIHVTEGAQVKDNTLLMELEFNV